MSQLSKCKLSSDELTNWNSSKFFTCHTHTIIKPTNLSPTNQRSTRSPSHPLVPCVALNYSGFFKKQPAAATVEGSPPSQCWRHSYPIRIYCAPYEQITLTVLELRSENVSCLTIVANGARRKQRTWGISGLHCFMQVFSFQENKLLYASLILYEFFSVIRWPVKQEAMIHNPGRE
jgi:hypothetical protein